MDKKKSGYETLVEKRPEFVKAFSELTKVLYSANYLDEKTKELVAVGVAVSKRCKPCMKAHIKKAYIAGANYEEILDAALVPVGFGGGPVYSSVVNDVMELLEELEK
ncbi:carboxymuconolactone decarboxylase family protein [Mycoplasma sp. 128]|uniref:carboxymuconolactone decarboxylase family protein n=1 Tax=Mycoplasma sp. 3341 TaxID=3447506 RepID=UPI003F65F8DE